MNDNQICKTKFHLTEIAVPPCQLKALQAFNALKETLSLKGLQFPIF